jgi:hypothetical protein
MPYLAELRVFDNSRERNPKTGKIPPPTLVLHWRGGAVVSLLELQAVPEWAKPIVACALQLQRAKS